MAQPPSAHSGGAAPLSLAQRFIGILTSPKATFESVVSFPRWFGMFLVVGLLFAAAATVFASTDIGHRVAVETAVAWGAPQDAAEKSASQAPYVNWIGVVIFTLIVTVVEAGILLGVFAITGGSASFKQVLAVVTHSAVVGAVLEPVHVAIAYFLDNEQRMTSLAGIGKAIQEKGFVAYFFAAIDLSFLLGFFVLAIGLGVLYRRRTAPIFVGLTAVYLVIAVVIGLVRTAFAGGS
jgi:hypothetical protein